MERKLSVNCPVIRQNLSCILLGLSRNNFFACNNFNYLVWKRMSLSSVMVEMKS